LDHAQLRALTGREEDWLARNPGIPSALAVTQLLASCLLRLGDAVPSLDLVRQLLAGDRDYLMLQLRRLTLEDELRGVVSCPQCAARMDVTFTTAEIPVQRHPQSSASYTVDLPGGSGGGRTVRFRLPTGADQEAALTQSDLSAEALFDRCLLDDGGTPLASEEREAVIHAMERLAPQLDVQLDLSCPECNHTFSCPFDTTAFFLHEMRVNDRQLLREFHSLAFHYHWSEAEILSLDRKRRRAYLAFLSDEFRRD
jgi:uncharacterized protein (UPF0212 family)